MSNVRGIIKSFYAIGSLTVRNSAGNFAIVDGDMSDDIIGPVTTFDKLDQMCYQVSWTSSDAVGVISVQGSVDGVNFDDITFTPALTQPDSDNGAYLINMALIPMPYIRIKYTRVSGSGNLVVYLSAKGL